ncbi:MAG TPA: hypothetical protein VMA36_02245 [Candidatus Limnocylindria bacterium]|jgi:hypothetical protein|nr:hypothetical protein [Candidatus Limnocylindria bacterium]
MNDSLFGADFLGNLIVIVGTIATVAAFIGAFRMTFWPGEKNQDHPKYTILREEY